MACTIYFRDNTEAQIASATQFGPVNENNATEDPDNDLIELRNASTRVALVPTILIKYIERTDP